MKRKKILILCNSNKSARNLCLNWHALLKNEIQTARCLLTERRIETPYAVIDFKISSDSKSQYDTVAKPGEQDAWIIKLATGRAMLK